MPKAIHPYDVIEHPLVTEKGSYLLAEDKYAFRVARGANKTQIKQAVEKAFNVRVLAVNVMNVRGKQRRWGRRQVLSSDWKKAIVTLAPGDKIELFEGV
ncbi:MAG: 50S ribosomal protein L23 [Dehalococcoidia bacterium SM23_28_2]|nr:MAG: 50S ribosomal protein L23 [Dehalococcoidia bacterium SM23_28_2]